MLSSRHTQSPTPLKKIQTTSQKQHLAPKACSFQNLPEAVNLLMKNAMCKVNNIRIKVILA